ncbi:signal peptide peptidase SppA [Chitinophaga sp. SYP-B3965]|uniref:signal peptide peptidase SppA n=1 Tax=Chitinophaga sp. SYP-B3965 TaxID=2663120 RepID=UPI001299E868|nr:signal peptide peptidase SppA [Chitinophaga sp. SYP-B3965]MRG43700.1 signal peptide peptidase SppA [Chitinophaga sp. SYP-B3965]
MRSFLKFFFASFVALIVFSIVGFFFVLMIAVRMTSDKKVVVGSNAVLVIDLNDHYAEQRVQTPLRALTGDGAGSDPGLYDAVRLIRQAATDDNVKGIYLKADGNGNGYASSEEIRRAIVDFAKSKKFVYAYGEVISQNAYFLASAANKVYLHPKGGIDFSGFSVTMMYLKGTLEKLEIQPQIFYNGKFKSATEPLRETKMTEANRIQTTAFLGELYGDFLMKVGASRGIDTATLHQYANEATIQYPEDALKYKLVDGLKYDDEIMDEIKRTLNLKGDDKVNFVALNKYDEANSSYEGSGNIALIYAEGDIVGGSADKAIASEDFIKTIREARQDKDIKAIVFRVNSPGGSALASEGIWRELTLARKAKPVIVTMGNYAASGGYYISCMADSIFAEPTTLTGSIGVFAILPNMQAFFNNKLGITFDAVKTAEYADLGSTSRPLTEKEKFMVQRSVDTIYATFKNRVTEGRKLQATIVDSIAQGRVWTGIQARKMGLVDRLGGIDDAVNCAARMANVAEVKIVAYPKPKDPYQQFFKSLGGVRASMVKEELGEHYQLYQTIKELKQLTGEIQAKLPYNLIIQ